VIRETGLFPYVGSDGKVIDFILRNLPNAKTFVEVFGGSGVVTLAVARRGMYEEIIWNDADELIYSAFYVVKEWGSVGYAVSDFVSWAKKFLKSPEGRRTLKEFLISIRDQLVRGEINNIYEKGFWVLILHHCFLQPFQSVPPFYLNTLLRSAVFRLDKPATREGLMSAYRERHLLLRRVKLMNMDGFKLIREMDRRDVIMYLDPPHVGYDYYRMNFTVRDAVRLANEVCRVRKAKVLVKLSYEDLPYYECLRRGWKSSEVGYRVSEPHSRRYSYYVFFRNYEPRRWW